jgi:hypothetical protein
MALWLNGWAGDHTRTVMGRRPNRLLVALTVSEGTPALAGQSGTIATALIDANVRRLDKPDLERGLPPGWRNLPFTPAWSRSEQLTHLLKNPGS